MYLAEAIPRLDSDLSGSLGRASAFSHGLTREPRSLSPLSNNILCLKALLPFPSPSLTPWQTLYLISPSAAPEPCPPPPPPPSRSRPPLQVLAQLEALCAGRAGPGDEGWAAGARECVVCLDAPRQTRLRPCCHALLCAPCAAELVRRRQRCPACRAAVEGFEEGAFDATYAPA